MRWAALLCGILSLILFPAPPGGADEGGPVIRIRARSMLSLSELHREEVSGGALRVSFQVLLQDGPSHAPLPGQRVQVRVPWPEGQHLGYAEWLTTDDEGRAAGPFVLAPGMRYQVSARYAGDSLGDPAEAQVICDLGRQQAHLTLDAPDSVPISGTLLLGVSLAGDGEEGPAGPVQVFVTGKQRKVALSRGRGEVSVEVPSLGPGPHGGGLVQVLAAFPGDLQYGPAQARREVLLTTQSQVTLDPPAAPAGEAPQGGRLLLTGAASDEDGPLAREQIEVLGRAASAEGPAEEPSGPLLLGSGVTDEAGHFRVVVARLPLKVGPAQVWARVVPGRSYRRGAQSQELPLSVLPPEPVSVLYYLVPLLLTVAGLFTRLGWRRRQAVLNALARLRRFFLPDPDPEGGLPDTAGAAGQPGVRLSQKNRMQVLLSRRTADLEVDGQVGDATTGAPVAAALVAVRPALTEVGAAPVMTGTSNAQGQFALRGLPPGSYHVEVSATGYLPESFNAILPHRGELRGVRVLLSPIRARIMEQWRRIAMPLLSAGGAGAQLSVWTPREIYKRACDEVGGPVLPPLLQLTDLVEDAYYSARPCTGEMLEQAVSLSAEVAAQQPAAQQHVEPYRKSSIMPQARPAED